MTGSTILDVVERLEAQHGRPRILPVFDPLEELISCILSQHTSDRSSYPAFVRLRKALPQWSEVVAAGASRVAEIIQHAGLANQKSRSIEGCLEAIFDRCGEFSLELLRPMPLMVARDWLTSLPGVGPKTASIVLCFSFGKNAAPVDTHVFRVAWRYGLIEKGRGASTAHDDLLATMPEGMAQRFHLSLLAHGRAICQARKPLCGNCVLAGNCKWFLGGGAVE